MGGFPRPPPFPATAKSLRTFPTSVWLRTHPCITVGVVSVWILAIRVDGTGILWADGGEVIGVPLRPIPGVVMDDTVASITGDWTVARRKDGYVGKGYRITEDSNATIEYLIQSSEAGRHELRMIYASDDHWAHSVSVGVDYRGVITRRIISQQKSPTDGYYKLIGRYNLRRGESLRIKMERPRGGAMYADAFQLLVQKDDPANEASNDEPRTRNEPSRNRSSRNRSSGIQP